MSIGRFDRTIFPHYIHNMIQALGVKKDINSIAHKHVITILRELMSDSDRGLVLRADFVRRLKKSIQSKRSGKYKNLGDVFKRYS